MGPPGRRAGRPGVIGPIEPDLKPSLPPKALAASDRYLPRQPLSWRVRVTDRAVSPPLLRARLRGGESGAAILEFSLVVLLFVSFLYALVAFGVILAKKQEITNA